MKRNLWFEFLNLALWQMLKPNQKPFGAIENQNVPLTISTYYSIATGGDEMGAIRILPLSSTCTPNKAWSLVY